MVAGVDSTTGGFAGGLDGQLGDWRFGAMVHAGSTVAAVPNENASSTSLDYGAGLYGGARFANTRLAFGGSYTRHDANSTRHVVFPGFDETLTAAYGAGTAEAFGQMSQEFDLGPVTLAPYAKGEYVKNMTDGYSESGGAAALTAAASDVEASFARLGLVNSRSAQGRMRPIRRRPSDAMISKPLVAPELLTVTRNPWDTAVEALLGVLLAFMPAALGAVDAWSELIVIGLAAAATLVVLTRAVVDRTFQLPWTWAYAPLAAFILLIIFQMAPLPASLAAAISPASAETRATYLGEQAAAPTATISLYSLATAHGLRLVLVGAALQTLGLGEQGGGIYLRGAAGL